MESKGLTFGKEGNGTFELLRSDKRYNVTNFQRSYTWGKEQINGIIKDIEFIDKNKEKTFVGWPSVLLQRVNQNKDDLNHYDIGDGQQRITSIYLTILAIYHRVLELNIKIGQTKIIAFEEELFGKNGIIGKRSADGTTIEPSLKFFTKEVNETFNKLFYRELLLHEKKKGKEEESSSSSIKIKNNFSILLEFFRRYDSFEKLEELYNIILNNFVSSVLIYEPNDNMHRAFSNMNSFGIPLSAETLVKAEIYGHVRKEDKVLSNEIARYWTKNLETEFWIDKEKLLEDFLIEFLNFYTNWNNDLLLKKKQLDSQWLKNSWSDLMQKIDSDEKGFSEFWELFKQSIEIYENAVSTKEFTTTELNWEINYTYHFLEKRTNSTPSIIMKIVNSSIDDEDNAKDCLSLLRRFSMYMRFVENEKNITKRLFQLGSPLLKEEKVLYKDLLRFLEKSHTGEKVWADKERIIKELSTQVYNNLYNPDICELFVLIANEERVENKEYSQKRNTRTHKNYNKDYEGLSREHILPQSGDVNQDEEEEYEKQVGRLGNSIVLDKRHNSKATTKNIKEKVKVYKKYEGLCGNFWTEDLEEIVNDTKEEWGYKSIDIRSNSVAEKIAKHISPSTPYSEFSVLKEHISPNEEIIIHALGISKRFTFNQLGNLVYENKKIIRTRHDLKETLCINLKKSVKRVKIKNKNDNEIIGFIKWDNETGMPSFKAELDSMVLYSEKFGDFEEYKNSKKILEAYIGVAYKFNGDSTVFAIQKSGVELTNDENITITNKKYMGLGANMFVLTSLPAEKTVDLINRIAESIGDEIICEL